MDFGVSQAHSRDVESVSVQFSDLPSAAMLQMPFAGYGGQKPEMPKPMDQSQLVKGVQLDYWSDHNRWHVLTRTCVRDGPVTIPWPYLTHLEFPSTLAGAGCLPPSQRWTTRAAAYA